MRYSLLAATAACILRPTNILIWFCVFMPAVTKFLLGFASPTQSASQSKGPTPGDYFVLVREAVLCVGLVAAAFVGSDYVYYGEWTFPAYQWLKFNLSEDLAVFYGRNDWHYYLSQGLPLLLTTYLPFTLIAAGKFLIWGGDSFKTISPLANNILLILFIIVQTTLVSMSLISHKEVRFIYPILPLLHIITAPVISSFFATYKTITTTPPPKPPGSKLPPVKPRMETVTSFNYKPLLIGIVLFNILIGAYTTQFHQRGVVSVMKFLRNEFETIALDPRGNLISKNMTYIYNEDVAPKVTDYVDDETFAGFLMPCHSTPWRSVMYHPDLKAWALTCEPPLNTLPHTAEREQYRDEADRFYDNPKKFLSEEIGGRDRPWPRYIVGFEGIEQPLREWYEENNKGFKMREKWSGFNSHWHDDERRRGKVVVWEFVDENKA